MNIQSIHSENRNSVLITRCCSFCRRPGHNITKCDSLLLRNFREYCENFISNINYWSVYNFQDESLNTVNELYSRYKNKFREFLLSDNNNDRYFTKCFARRFCGATGRNNIIECIDIIIIHFNGLIWNVFIRSHDYIIYNYLNNINLINNLISNSSDNNSSQEISSPNLIAAFMFTEMMNSINSMNYDNINLNKKFNINTKIYKSKKSESCDCDICYENFEKANFIKLNCGHEFCKDCIKNSLKNEKKDIFTCAFCRAEINEFQISNHEIKEEFNDLLL